MNLLCVLCGGFAPYMLNGTSYCHAHMRAVYKRMHEEKKDKKDDTRSES